MSNLTKKQIEVEENERRRIAKDLHDSLGQQLSAIKLYLGTLNKIHVPNEKNHKILLSKSVSAIDEAIADLSNICFNLMPVTLSAYGLIHATEDLARKISFLRKVAIKVVSDPSFPALDKTLEINIFRIIQEFINNSVKHGHAQKITINLHYSRPGKKLEIVLKDNGKGFDLTKLKKADGMGLKNVKSRVDYHKGEFTLKSSKKFGTQYDISIPLKKHLN